MRRQHAAEVEHLKYGMNRATHFTSSRLPYFGL